MKFGVRLPNSGPFASLGALREMTLVAEELGYDSVSVHDHVNWGESDKYHFYAGSIEVADAAEKPYDFFSAYPTMAYLAGITQRVRLIPAALCLAWRHPLIVAREASTLHALSEGRFVLAVCAGNVRRDFEVTGTSWDERGRLTEESLQVIRMALDQDGPISFSGKHFSFKDADIHPRPAGLSLWYCGTSKAAVRRTGTYGDGWMPGGGPRYFSDNLPVITEIANGHGREVDFESAMITRLRIGSTREDAMNVARRTLAFQSEAEWLKRHDLHEREKTWLVGTADDALALIREAEDAGVGVMLHTIIGHSIGDVVDQMKIFAEEIAPSCR